MTRHPQARLILALVGSAVIAAWGAREILSALLDPVLRGLGS